MQGGEHDHGHSVILYFLSYCLIQFDFLRFSSKQRSKSRWPTQLPSAFHSADFPWKRGAKARGRMAQGLQQQHRICIQHCCVASHAAAAATRCLCVGMCMDSASLPCPTVPGPLVMPEGLNTRSSSAKRCWFRQLPLCIQPVHGKSVSAHKLADPKHPGWSWNA